MITLKTTGILRLRESPGMAGITIDEIRQGTVCYAVGDAVEKDGLQWANIVALTKSGVWHEGYSALFYQGDPLLVDYVPGMTNLSPVHQPVEISQLFGENPISYAPFGLSGHNGIDFATPIGTPIAAVASGLVVHARVDQGYGNYVRIDHPWGITLYAHLLQLAVREGDTVHSGQDIGRAGNSGNSTGPHLHFEVRLHPIDGNNGYGGRIDPLPLLNRSLYTLRNYAPVKLRKAFGNG